MKYFVERFKDAPWGFYVFITDGELHDLDAVKDYSTQLARAVAADGLAVLEQCRALVRDLHARHGERVSLIGWSLGGVFARELAKEMPRETRCVITLTK